MEEKKVNWNNVIMYIVMLSLVLISNYRYKKYNESVRSEDMTMIVNLARLSSVLEYQKAILKEVNSLEDDESLSFGKVNDRFGFDELDSICTGYFDKER